MQMQIQLTQAEADVLSRLSRDTGESQEESVKRLLFKSIAEESSKQAAYDKWLAAAIEKAESSVSAGHTLSIDEVEKRLDNLFEGLADD